MNRRDFETLARAIKRLAGDRNGGQSKETVAETLADAFGLSLEGRALFLKRCGVANGE